MRYALVVITHGDGPHLDETVESFAEMVTPHPATRLCVTDGPGRMPPVEPLGPWFGYGLPDQKGFCHASARGWLLARAAIDVDWIFWLENDFRFDCPVDLEAVAAVLSQPTEQHLAQMALMRQPVSEKEVAVGGVVASRPGEFVKMTQPELTDATGNVVRHAAEWLVQRAYWTTNPSLFRQSLTVEQDWPVGKGCEGRFGIQLRAAGYSFGVWGDGHPWVTHLGGRGHDGFGY